MPTYHCDADGCDQIAAFTLSEHAAAETVFLCVPHLVEAAVALGNALLVASQPEPQTYDSHQEAVQDRSENFEYQQADPQPKRRQKGVQAPENGAQEVAEATTTAND